MHRVCLLFPIPLYQLFLTLFGTTINLTCRYRRSRDHYIKHGMITVRALPYLIRVARHILLIQALQSLEALPTGAAPAIFAVTGRRVC